MSYLRSPRIHFAGRFQADTSTVNNDVRHFDEARFRDDFQEPMEVKDDKIVKYNGYWNPEGSGAWRLLGCRVTSAVLDGRALDRPGDDPVVGLAVGGSNDRVAGKLVDLDPQQQMVSQIWGLAVRVEGRRGAPAFRGEFDVAAFCDIWRRQQHGDQFLDQQLAAAYQSVLSRVEWLDFEDSPCLAALKARTAEGLLSIRMNVFGYDRTPAAADYGTGVVVGTIGPAASHEPKHFAVGRHLTASLPQGPGYPFTPANQVSNIQVDVDRATRTVGVDFGNALPITDSSGTLEDLGVLEFGVLKDAGVKQGDAVAADRVELLGMIPYRDEGWYFKTAGVRDFPLREGAGAIDIIDDHPLAVVRRDPNGQYTVLNRETADGLYVRADGFVYRLNPGESAHIDFHATRYGHPIATAVTAGPTEGFMGGPGTGADLPITIPDVNTPAGIIGFKAEFETGPDGRASLTISAAEQGPGNPRQYLDGQVYGIAYQIKDLPADYNANPFNYISVLAWDRFDVPEHPTWFQHIRPILSQYGNLYPIMSKRLIDLHDYESVVGNLGLMKLGFSLPIDNPNSMPVTRDLSAGKRRTILKWLDAKDPGTGLPPLGDAPPPVPPDGADAGAGEAPGSEPNLASKVDFLRQALKHGER